MKGEIYNNNIISIWIGAWLCPTSTARRWVKVSWFLKNQTKNVLFCLFNQVNAESLHIPSPKGERQSKKREKKERK